MMPGGSHGLAEAQFLGEGATTGKPEESRTPDGPVRILTFTFEPYRFPFCWHGEATMPTIDIVHLAAGEGQTKGRPQRKALIQGKGMKGWDLFSAYLSFPKSENGVGDGRSSSIPPSSIPQS